MKTETTTAPVKYLYRLVCDQTKEVLKEGSFYACLGKFQQVCGLSFTNHKTYSYDTYSIVEIN